MEELGRPSGAEFRDMKKIPVVVVLENVRSASNVGSVFRTADAFAIEKIFLTGYTATPPHRDILKTALGATESVDWEYNESSIALIEGLKAAGYTILCVEQTTNSISLEKFDVQNDQKLVLIFGNEVDGVASKTLLRAHNCLEIRQHGTKHSLNVSVCAGIVLFHLSVQFHELGTT